MTTCEKPQNDNWEASKPWKVLSILYGPDDRKYGFLRDVLIIKQRASVKTRDVYDVRGMYSRVFGFNFSMLEKPGEPEVFLRPVVTWTCEFYFYITFLTLKCRAYSGTWLRLRPHVNQRL